MVAAKIAEIKLIFFLEDRSDRSDHMETQFVVITGIKHLPGCSALLFVRSFQAYFCSVEIVVIACKLVARSRQSKVPELLRQKQMPSFFQISKKLSSF